LTVRALAAALAALVLATSPAAAQQDATAAENLDCAIWAAFVAGANDDPEVETAFGIILSWFVGLYEGQTGRVVDAAFTARAEQLTDEDLQAIEERCLPRVEAYGERLSALGDRLQGPE
jgi:hypothetical protein